MPAVVYQQQGSSGLTAASQAVCDSSEEQPNFPEEKKASLLREEEALKHAAAAANRATAPRPIYRYQALMDALSEKCACAVCGQPAPSAALSVPVIFCSWQAARRGETFNPACGD